MPACIAGCYRYYALYGLEDSLGAPKAAVAKRYFLYIHNYLTNECKITLVYT
ncbi:MAG: hypothetical protein JWQ85_3539 [Mucilaginibacter sp.]|nr:hypothetical protein [Mucilaginibacter sp.]